MATVVVASVADGCSDSSSSGGEMTAPGDGCDVTGDPEVVAFPSVDSVVVASRLAKPSTVYGAMSNSRGKAK